MTYTQHKYYYNELPQTKNIVTCRDSKKSTHKIIEFTNTKEY